MSQLDVVTGAFSYTGSAIANRLLERGYQVLTVTGHPDRPHPLQGRVDARSFSFEDPARLVASLVGCNTLYNTYWVRFAHGNTDFDLAVRNTRILIEAAKSAGLERIVHVSICKADDSSLPYFEGKQRAEQIVRASGIPYSIVRPTVLFGRGDVLVNNIAWLLGRFPFFAIAGDGRYAIQPVHVDDVARICVEAADSSTDEIVDAAGPETYPYEEFVRLIAHRIGSKARLIHLDQRLALGLATFAGLFVRDRVVTAEELDALVRGLAASSHEPYGKISFRDWLDSHSRSLGREWASELGRHYRSAGQPSGKGEGDELRIA